ncbi:hypothetical protein Ccrd_025184 [Cynara cardunculus var. scolymus]|uniref:PRONE domain-containing protein n=1 Tax=Cynara cardunculus var. scolymus TaxID=59895 RepID=A0A118JS19_CYNCS|nr:hypothetical protein Ccrd_025184 [Cynara cardunculus var. scolymus]
MVLLRRRLNCCTWFKGISNSIDLDQPPDTSKGDGFPTDSPDEDTSSCCSSNNPSGSSFSQWTTMKRDEHGLDEWEYSDSPSPFIAKEKPSYAVQFSDVEVMKEKFAKLLLGEDTTGGRNGASTALALDKNLMMVINMSIFIFSYGICGWVGAVFGELWKLEPLPEEKRIKWRREMEWLLSPTNYMVQLIPAKQCGADGRILEASFPFPAQLFYFIFYNCGVPIMTPKARGDIHLNLPALRKLDSMLLETLDSMIDMEFWYEEGGSRAEGRSRNVKQSKRWWLPMPQVPIGGLSDGGRKKLLNQAKLVHQIFKAAKSINETILLEMPIPKIIAEALPKSGKASLGEDLYRILNRVPSSAAGMLKSLSLKSENNALDAINRLEAAIHAWKEKIEEHDAGKSPARTSWSFKDPILELDKMELLINRAEDLSREIHIRYPNLPQKFLDVMKIQYSKDVAHAILEAYSRVLGNLAFSILTRIGDICQEDVLSDPDSPMATNSVPGLMIHGMSGSNNTTLIDEMNSIEGKLGSLQAEEASILSDEPYTRSVTATPSRISGCCLGKEAYFMSPTATP